MKSKFFLFILVNCTVIANAQQLAYNEGDKVLDLTIGLGSPYWGSGFKSSLPVNPRVGFEYGITENISGGGSVAYSSSSYDYGYGYGKIKYTGLFISARGSYHFATTEKFDPYAGLSLGYVLVTVSDSYSGYVASASSGVGYGLHLGARYFFQPKFGLNAELGYSSFSFLNAGVCFKF
jgi:opacity protein-like surface antigen